MKKDLKNMIVDILLVDDSLEDAELAIRILKKKRLYIILIIIRFYYILYYANLFVFPVEFFSTYASAFDCHQRSRTW